MQDCISDCPLCELSSSRARTHTIFSCLLAVVTVFFLFFSDFKVQLPLTGYGLQTKQINRLLHIQITSTLLTVPLYKLPCNNALRIDILYPITVCFLITIATIFISDADVSLRVIHVISKRRINR